jgi:acetate kinase
MTTSLGGLDALVFTAGVGEGSSAVRGRVCSKLGFLGVAIAASANDDAVADVDISESEAATRVWVVHAREDVVAARAARRAL